MNGLELHVGALYSVPGTNLNLNYSCSCIIPLAIIAGGGGEAGAGRPVIALLFLLNGTICGLSLEAVESGTEYCLLLRHSTPFR